MKKLIILPLSLLLFVSFANAQTWDSLGAGIKYGFVQAMTEYNGSLYVGGSFNTAGNIASNSIAQWNVSGWDSTNEWTIEAEGGGTGIFSEMVYDGDLYVGGAFYEPLIKTSNIAQWNGLKWDSVSSGIKYRVVNALEVYNGNLIAGGNFDTAGGKAMYGIAQWDGSSWDTVSSGTHGTIYALTLYNGDLYAAGSFDTIGHIIANNIAMWNGTNWTPLGLGIDSTVYSLAVYNGSLYAGGTFKNAGGIPAKNIAVWNGSNWDSVGGGISGNINYTGVFALIQYGSILCAGGSFDSVGNIAANNIAFWNGSSWSAMGNGITGPNNPYVLSLYSASSILYVGGAFNSADGIAANNIAQWRSPLGIDELNEKNRLITLFPNPSSGLFTISLTGEQNLVPATIEIYNVMGEKVLTEIRQLADDNLINLTDQPSGVYFYRVLQSDGALIGEGKIIVQK